MSFERNASQPVGGLVISAAAQEPEQQQRVHACADAGRERQAGVPEELHEDDRERLRDENRDECDLHRRLHVLARVEAGRQDLHEDQPSRPTL